MRVHVAPYWYVNANEHLMFRHVRFCHDQYLTIRCKAYLKLRLESPLRWLQKMVVAREKESRLDDPALRVEVYIWPSVSIAQSRLSRSDSHQRRPSLLNGLGSVQLYLWNELVECSYRMVYLCGELRTPFLDINNKRSTKLTVKS